MTALTTLKNLMLGILVLLVSGTSTVAAYTTYPGVTTDGCKPVYVDDGEPQIDPTCIGPGSVSSASPASPTVYTGIDGAPQVDPDPTG